MNTDARREDRTGYKTETGARSAVLVGVMLNGDPHFNVELQELEGLAKTLGIDISGIVTQSLSYEDNATCCGSGKVEEIRELVLDTGADLVIFNNTLSPSQIANLGNLLETEVLDRTNLILRIFSMHARTRESRIQVEYASLKYMLPRLVGLRRNLSRQAGTGGSMSNKGSGEMQIELDRRHIEKRMASLRRELEKISQSRETQTKKRESSQIPLVAMVGYTNAGKSTLMNSLIDWCGEEEEKHVFVKDMLFATLDTTVRKIRPEGSPPFLLSDTVGFISALPADLVEAFHSTLEEAVKADLLLEVVDAFDPDHAMQMEVTERTLRSLGAGSIPLIRVMNKVDLDPDRGEEIPYLSAGKIYLSARSGKGIGELISLIGEHLYGEISEVRLLIPYRDSAVEHQIQEWSEVLEETYEGDGMHLTVRIREKLLRAFAPYVTGVVS